MGAPLGDLAELLRNLAPALDPAVYVFASVPGLPAGLAPLATIREEEGLSVILEAGEAARAGLEPLFRARRITLTVHSDLAAVGLTAAVSGALAGRGIGCNVVAGAFHDHLFVPADRAEEAMVALISLSSGR